MSPIILEMLFSLNCSKVSYTFIIRVTAERLNYCCLFTILTQYHALPQTTSCAFQPIYSGLSMLKCSCLINESWQLCNTGKYFWRNFNVNKSHRHLRVVSRNSMLTIIVTVLSHCLLYCQSTCNKSRTVIGAIRNVVK